MTDITALGLTRDSLSAAVDANMVSCTKHPDAGLWIYNYTPRAVYAQRTIDWSPETLHSRGLILDRKMNIIARSMPKFFNLGQHKRSDVTLSKQFTVQDKLDGSLGIMYLGPDGPAIATRGSFTSNQALRATKILNEQYGQWAASMEANDDINVVTFLFEIIYPQNRIVLDYGDMEDLVSLTVINIATGEEMHPHDFGWEGPVVKVFDMPEGARIPPKNILEHFEFLGDGSAEGFVLKFDHGPTPVRIKVKFDEYVRLHRVMTGTSTKTVWEYLSQGWDLDELIANTPDEFFDFVTETMEDLQQQYVAILDEANGLFADVLRSLPDGPPEDDRKVFAMAATQTKYPGLLFSILDGKDVGRQIWKMIEPEYSRPFSNTSSTPQPVLVNGERQPALIVDRDGTLASVEFSRQFVNPERDADGHGGKKDWASFNAHLPFDPVVPIIAALVRSIRPGVKIIMTTGRTDDLRGVMLAWIAKHELPIDLLLMRKTGDQRKDSIVKTEIFRNQIEPFYDVRYVIDDRPQVCDAWRELGLPLMQVVDPGIMPFHGGNWTP